MSANKAILTIVVLCLGIFAVRGYLNQDKAEAEVKQEVKADVDDDNDFSIKINDEEIKIEGLEEAMNSVKESLESLGDGEETEVADFRKLKEVLPEKLVGLKRTERGGEKSGIKGFMVAKADATYRDDDRKIEIELIDTGGMALAQLGFAAWAKVEIDRESDDGYEKTYTKDGVRYHEEYDTDRQRGSLKALFQERLILSIEIREMPASTFGKIVKKLDIEDLKL